jgi:hypothetical protein
MTRLQALYQVRQVHLPRLLAEEPFQRPIQPFDSIATQVPVKRPTRWRPTATALRRLKRSRQ